MLFNDLAFNKLLNGSPSSISNWSLITFSKVILLPKIFILSTKNLSLSLIEIVKFSLFSSIIVSVISALIKSNWRDKDILSISSITLLTLNKE